MVGSDEPIGVERPLAPPEDPAIGWGSDAIAEILRRLDLPFISLNPGASYRGLHDSLVNFTGNRAPEIVLCLHEEHAVALAHGFAKVTGRPMAVALHSNVGLMHATMALFNAFCDRVPMVVLGATGPLDASRRRPWIDWIHTAADQAALIRDYVRWDDQPGSIPAAIESIVRADQLTRGYPSAPTYVCLDSALQEAPLEVPPRFPDPARHRPPALPGPDPRAASEIATALARSERPLLAVGRVGRDEASWAARVELAERLQCAVISDLRVGAGFPSGHPLHPVAPGTFLPEPAAALLREADLVLALDWVDLGGTLAQAYGEKPVGAHIVAVGNDSALHNGWSKDHFALAPVDLAIAAHPDPTVDALLGVLEARAATPGWPPPRAADPPPRTADPPPRTADPPPAPGERITVSDLARSLRRAIGLRPSCLVRAPLGWSGEDWSVAGPLDYLGQDGGAGLGSGPGMAVGAALALRGSGRLPVAVLGDGDLLMGATALWTAARYRLPLLVVVANNGTYLNDEIHQERVARARARPVENRWVGQRIADPDPDLAALASSLGLRGIGPVAGNGELDDALDGAVAAVLEGEAVLVDVRVSPNPKENG